MGSPHAIKQASFQETNFVNFSQKLQDKGLFDVVRSSDPLLNQVQISLITSKIEGQNIQRYQVTIPQSGCREKDLLQAFEKVGLSINTAGLHSLLSAIQLADGHPDKNRRLDTQKERKRLDRALDAYAGSPQDNGQLWKQTPVYQNFKNPYFAAHALDLGWVNRGQMHQIIKRLEADQNQASELNFLAQQTVFGPEDSQLILSLAQRVQAKYPQRASALLEMLSPQLLQDSELVWGLYQNLGAIALD
ncbi:MAG: hypothetical protein KDK66_06795, partial [Deltaproteobacteria bacterium]|nr:hypothetical protein [Deltaproteobacteria bacterium]